MINTQLTLTTMIERTTYVCNTQIFVQVILKNVSQVPLWVNKRMAMGYEDNLERELFMTVQTPNGHVLRVPEPERIDVHLMPPKREDFLFLSPGEAITTIVDAAMWYPFRQPGRFHIIFTYDNRVDGKEFNLEAFVGTVNANPLTIVLQ